MPRFHTLVTDLIHLGEVFDALSHTPAIGTECKEPLTFPVKNGVLHFSAFPRPVQVADNRFSLAMSRLPTMSSMSRPSWASARYPRHTQSNYGCVYSQHDQSWTDMPVSVSSYECDPTDSYGLISTAGRPK